MQIDDLSGNSLFLESKVQTWRLSRPACPGLPGQGSTEYLILLAVVLIVALVSIALLGFFPGLSTEARITQSQAYWKSASPIAIVEASAKATYAGYSLPYLRIRNNGPNTIRITKIVGPSNQYISKIFIGVMPFWEEMSNYYLLAPGEEKYFATKTGSMYNGPYGGWDVPDERGIEFGKSTMCSSSECDFCGAESVCDDTGASNTGMLVMKSFGFEYIEYIDGQSITKRQIGTADLIVKCIR